jgi:hypothetical protein
LCFAEPIKVKLQWLQERSNVNIHKTLNRERDLIRDEVKELTISVLQKEKKLSTIKIAMEDIDSIFKEQTNNEKLVKDVIDGKFHQTISQLNDHLTKQAQRVLDISDGIGSAQKYRFKVMSMLDEISKKRLHCDPFVRRRAMNLVKGLIKNLDEAALIAMEERENRLREQFRVMLELKKNIANQESNISELQLKSKNCHEELLRTAERISYEKIEFKERAQVWKVKDEKVSEKLKQLENQMSEFAREQRRQAHQDNRVRKASKRVSGGNSDSIVTPLSNDHFVKHLEEKLGNPSKQTVLTKKTKTNLPDQHLSQKLLYPQQGNLDDDPEVINIDDDNNEADQSSGDNSDVASDTDQDSDFEELIPSISAVNPLTSSMTIKTTTSKQKKRKQKSQRAVILDKHPVLLDQATEDTLDISVNEGGRKEQTSQKLSKVAVIKAPTMNLLETHTESLNQDDASRNRVKRMTQFQDAHSTTSSTLRQKPSMGFSAMVIEEEDGSDSNDSVKSEKEKSELISPLLLMEQSSLKLSAPPPPSHSLAVSNGLLKHIDLEFHDDESIADKLLLSTSTVGRNVTNAAIDSPFQQSLLIDVCHPVNSSLTTACYAHYYQEYVFKHPGANFERYNPRYRRQSSFSMNSQRKAMSPMISIVNHNTFQFTIEESSKVLLEVLSRIVNRRGSESAELKSSANKTMSLLTESEANGLQFKLESIVKMAKIHQASMLANKQMYLTQYQKAQPSKTAIRKTMMVQSSNSNNSSSNDDTTSIARNPMAIYSLEYLQWLFSYHEYCKDLFKVVTDQLPRLLLINNTRTMFAKVLVDIMAIMGVILNVTLFFWNPAVLVQNSAVVQAMSGKGNEEHPTKTTGTKGNISFDNPPTLKENPFALIKVDPINGWIDVFGRQVVDILLHYGRQDETLDGNSNSNRGRDARRMTRVLQQLQIRPSAVKSTRRSSQNAGISFQNDDLQPYADPDLLFRSLFSLIEKFFIPDHFRHLTSNEPLEEMADLVAFFMSECRQLLGERSPLATETTVDLHQKNDIKTFELQHRNALQCIESFLLTVFHVNDAQTQHALDTLRNNATDSNRMKLSQYNKIIMLKMLNFYFEKAKLDGDAIGKVKSGYVVEQVSGVDFEYFARR